MKATVQARLDPESRRTLDLLTARLGWTESKAVREGLRLLAATNGRAGRPKVAGVGKFASGVRDLGSNRKHLRGFGR